MRCGYFWHSFLFFPFIGPNTMRERLKYETVEKKSIYLFVDCLSVYLSFMFGVYFSIFIPMECRECILAARDNGTHFIFRTICCVTTPVRIYSNNFHFPIQKLYYKHSSSIQNLHFELTRKSSEQFWINCTCSRRNGGEHVL